mgnify:CR=1 FL=1
MSTERLHAFSSFGPALLLGETAPDQVVAREDNRLTAKAGASVGGLVAGPPGGAAGAAAGAAAGTAYDLKTLNNKSQASWAKRNV